MNRFVILLTFLVYSNFNFSQLNRNNSALLFARPNPTSGDSELLADSSCLNKKAIVFNQSGQQVDAFVISNLRQRIPSNFYQRGIYYIRIENNNTLRLIKE